MSVFRIILVAGIVISNSLTCSGQQYPDSLQEYIDIAIGRNPVVQQKLAEYQAALQKVPQVRSLPDPELSAGVYLKPMELIAGNQVADIRLMQMFPWFGVLKNASEEMELMARAKFEIVNNAKLEIRFNVQRTWYDLFKIRKEISISERNMEILKIIERLALVKYKAPPAGNAGTLSSGTGMAVVSPASGSMEGPSGMQSMGGSESNKGYTGSSRPSGEMNSSSMGTFSGNTSLADLYQIQIETGELEENISQLKNEELVLKALFNSYLNRQPGSPVSAGEILATDSLHIPLSAVNDSILKKNPMLEMAEFEKQSYEARKKMNSAMGYPMIGIGLNYSVITKNSMSASSMNGNDMLMPMVTLTLPIYRRKYAAMVNEADLLKSSAINNYEAAKNSLQVDFYRASQLYKDSQRRIRLYENQYELASKSLDLMIKSFSVSSTGLTEVLRVCQQTLDYELKKVEAIADFNTAVAWLNRLMAN